MEDQLRLAELYRELGREDEALAIEDALRRYQDGGSAVVDW